MNVTLLGGFNPETPSAGGVRAYVESLSRYLDTVGIAHLCVVSGKKRYTGENWCSVPVRKFGSTAQWLAALVVNLRTLPISEDSIIHAQRPDDLIPFLLSGLGRARVCTMHGNPLQAINERRSPSTYASYALIEDAVLRRTDRVVFVDAKTASQYVRRYPWLDGYVEVIPNGVDTSLFKPLDKFSAKQKWGFNGTVLLYAGRLEPEKQVSEIVRTFGELGREDCSLVVAGGGRDKPLIEGASTGLNVRFLGSVPRSEMPSLMNAADALIMYSTREGLPATVLEALACGVPVVVTPVGVLPDVVRSGENGFFASSRAELKEAMEKMLRGDFSDRASIRRTILRYSWEELGPRIVQAYARAERHGAPEVPN